MNELVGPESKVVSLAEFRRKVTPVPEAQAPVAPDPYKRLDYLGFKAVKRTLELIKGGSIDTTKSRLSIVYQVVSDQPSGVTSTRGQKFAIDANRDELEALTLDLEDTSDEEQRRLKNPLTRLYYATLIGRHELQRQTKLSSSSKVQVSDPVVGTERIRLEGDNRRWQKATYLRTAAGLGLIAVAEKRPKLQAELRGYLHNVFEYRHNYNLGWEEMASKLLPQGTPREERPALEDFLLGVCNPLAEHEAKRVLRNSPPVSS